MVKFMTEEPREAPPFDEKTLMHAFGLPLLEAKFLHAMIVQEWVGEEELPAIKYSIRQLIYKLRNKLGGIDRRIWVINDGSGKYGITPTGKNAIREIIINKVLAE